MIDRIDYTPHCKREKSKYMGEMIQMDASSFDFLGNGIKLHLHIAVDDCTNTIVGAYFDYQESLKGYYNVIYQIVSNYGIPFSFYTDRRTVFEYKRLNTSDLDKDTKTQFSYACHQLGIEIKTTSVPQAKGLVEKVNDTLQLRLPIELKLAGIKTIDEANEFLKCYLDKYNQNFAHQVNDSRNVFVKQDVLQKLNYILGIIDNRTIQNDHSIKYNKKSYFPVDKNGEKKFFKAGTKILVIRALNGELYASIEGEIACLVEIQNHKAISKNFDFEKPVEKKPRKVYIPPMDHPWRKDIFNSYLQKMEHRGIT